MPFSKVITAGGGYLLEYLPTVGKFSYPIFGLHYSGSSEQLSLLRLLTTLKQMANPREQTKISRSRFAIWSMSIRTTGLCTFLKSSLLSTTQYTLPPACRLCSSSQGSTLLQQLKQPPAPKILLRTLQPPATNCVTMPETPYVLHRRRCQFIMIGSTNQLCSTKTI